MDNKIDKQIKRMMLEYPSLFPSRVECWSQLFGTGGNGYHWNDDGDLISFCDDASYPTSIKLATPHKLPFEMKSLDIKMEMDNLMYKFREKHIDFLSGYGFYNITRKMGIFDIWSLRWEEDVKNCFMPGIMQQACIDKEKISIEWRKEISYYCDWVRMKIRHFVLFPMHQDEIPTDEEVIEKLESCNHIRHMYEVQKAFICVKKVLNNLFTEEEINEKKNTN